MLYSTEPILDETTETALDEGDIVHIVCCVTDTDDISITKSLCGETIDIEGPPNYSVDEDCRRCYILEEADYCPLFGTCEETDLAENT